MSAPQLIDIGELATLLDQRVGTLAPELLPNGKKRGNLWRTGSIEDEPGESLAVNLSGAYPGKWTDFSADKGARDRSGDMLTLVALVHFGGDRRRACDWARSYLGLDTLDPQRIATVRAEATRRQVSADKEAKRKAEWMRRKAQALFIPEAGCVPIENSPAELYLASRGIDLSLLARSPRALGFHPAVWNEEAKADLPCMLARILDAHGNHIATHRTWIEPDPAGHLWRKARLVNAKMALGAFTGGYIPLWKGESRVSLHKIPTGLPIAVSEGIEDGLTIACACPDLRVIAAVSLSNIANLPIPPNGPDGAPSNRVTIVGQRDAQGSQADLALKSVVAKLTDRGVDVFLALPLEGFKDANDVLAGVIAA